MGFLSSFDAQDISNTAWAFATLGIQTEALMAALAEWTLQQDFLSTNFDHHHSAPHRLQRLAGGRCARVDPQR